MKFSAAKIICRYQVKNSIGKAYMHFAIKCDTCAVMKGEHELDAVYLGSECFNVHSDIALAF